MNSLFSKYCAECRTFRRFKQIPVPETLLQNLIEDVRIAPSARNCQVLRYVVVNDKDTVARIQPFFHFAAALPPQKSGNLERENSQPHSSLSVQMA